MVTNVRIDAAIMSLLHSFIVDNYDCGELGTLTVNGAIVQSSAARSAPAPAAPSRPAT